MPVTTTFLTTTTPSIALFRGTASSQSVFFVDNTVFGPFPRSVSGYAVTGPQSRSYSTITNYIVGRIKSFYETSNQGYARNRFYSLFVSSSTRVTAKNFNSILTDVDLLYRHQSSATVLSTVTNLSSATASLIVEAYPGQGPSTYSSTLTYTATNRISTASVSAVIKLLDELELNRFKVNLGNLAKDSGGCFTIYDQGIDYRTLPWGADTGTVSVVYRVQWPRPALANSFFNLGSDLVLTPFFSSYGPRVELPAQGTSTQFQTALDTFVNVPLSINGVGGGIGPLWHVNYALRPYGPPRAGDSTDYFYPIVGGPGVSANASFLNTLTNSPVIRGTPFQLVGLHYGDYSTKLVIGCRQDQTVGSGVTNLRVSLSGPLAIAGGYYDVTVPGNLGRYTGPANPGLSSTSGWWVYDYDSTNETFTTSTVGYIDIWTGRKGPDPIGLERAVTSRQAHTITITPTGTGATQNAADPRGTATNAISLLINELNIRGLNTGTNPINSLFSYSRDQWFSTTQTFTATYTSTVWTGPYVTVVAQRNSSTVGQSNSLTVTVSVISARTGTNLVYDSALNPNIYFTSFITCTNVTAGGNSFDGVAITPGVEGSGPPPWLDQTFTGPGGDVSGL